MKLDKKTGSTSEIWEIWIADSSSTTGAGLTGLTQASSGLTAYYHRNTDTTATVITLVTMTVGTFTSSGFKEIDATNLPGWYQFCPPNACLASGAKSVSFLLKGATNMAPLPIEVQLVGYDPDSATVTLAATTHTGAIIPTVSAVTGLTASNLDATISSRMASYTQPTGFLASTFPTTVASTTNITAGTITTVTNLTNAPTAGDLTATMKTSVTTAATAATPTAAAVTGAVGSVTGNVGGSVASVTARVTANTDQLAGQTVTAAAGVTFPTSVASPTNITAGTISTVTNLTNAPTSGDLTATMKASVTTAATAATPVAASVTGAVGSVAAGGITASSFGASAIDAAALATDAGQEIADRLLTRALGGGADTGRTVRQALATLRNKVEIAGGTMTVYAEDDSSSLFTAAVTTTAGNPVTAIDPA